jgi:uncharacterized protein
MLKRFPEHIDPQRLCERGDSIEGRIALDTLPRLAPLLASTEGEAAFTLAFGQDDRKKAHIEGNIRATLVLECQRCLGPVEYPVDEDFILVPVSGFLEAEQLPESQEPLLLEDDRPVAVKELIEDELLLLLPTTPKHEDDICAVADEYRTEPQPEAAEQPEERENPFAVLAALRKQGDETDS